MAHGSKHEEAELESYKTFQGIDKLKWRITGSTAMILCEQLYFVQLIEMLHVEINSRRICLTAGNMLILHLCFQHSISKHISYNTYT